MKFRNLVFAVGLTSASLALGVACPQQHCSWFANHPKARDTVSKNCREAMDNYNRDAIKRLFQNRGNEPKPSVVVPYEDTFCSCPCSCYGDGASLAGNRGDIAVEDLRRGQHLLTEAGVGTITEVMRSDVKDFPAVKVTFEHGRSMVLSQNHAVVLAGHLVADADTLRPGSRVLGDAGEVRTVARVEPTRYTGTFHNVILDAKRNDAADRVVFSEGIQSGDWMVQTYRDSVGANIQVREVLKAKAEAK